MAIDRKYGKVTLEHGSITHIKFVEFGRVQP